MHPGASVFSTLFLYVHHPFLPPPRPILNLSPKTLPLVLLTSAGYCIFTLSRCSFNHYPLWQSSYHYPTHTISVPPCALFESGQVSNPSTPRTPLNPLTAP